MPSFFLLKKRNVFISVRVWVCGECGRIKPLKLSIYILELCEVFVLLERAFQIGKVRVKPSAPSLGSSFVKYLRSIYWPKLGHREPLGEDPTVALVKTVVYKVSGSACGASCRGIGERMLKDTEKGYSLWRQVGPSSRSGILR